MNLDRLSDEFKMKHAGKITSIKMKRCLDSLKQQSESTPDFLELKSDYGSIIPLFIYDEMMKGQADDNVLKDCLYLGPATSTEDDFVLLKNSNERVVMFPMMKSMREELALVPNNYRRVQGDLYGVPLDMIMYLDKVYNIGEWYYRTEIPIMLHQTISMQVRLRRVPVYLGEWKFWGKSQRTYADKFRLANTMTSRYHSIERVYHGFDKEPVTVGTIHPDNTTNRIDYHVPYRSDRDFWMD